MIHSAHAYGPGKLHREGVEEMKKGHLQLAEGQLKRAYEWAKRQSGDKINPSFVTDYCNVLVLLKNWYYAKDICAEAAKLDTAHAAKVKRLQRQIAHAKLVGKAETAAKWAAQDLRGDRYDSAVEGYHKAIKIYPRADFYLGLCKALNKQGNPGKALAACNRVLKMKADAATRSAARALIAPLKKASASAFSPEQKKAVDKVRDYITKIQFIRPDQNLRDDSQAQYVAQTQGCADEIAKLRKSGVTLTRNIRVYDAPRGIKVRAKTRKIQNGRFTGWWKLVRLADLDKMCRGFALKLKLRPLQKAMRKMANQVQLLVRLERERPSWKKADRSVLIPAIGGANSLVDASKHCNQPIGLAIAQGLPKTTPVDTQAAGRILLAQLKAKLCVPLATRAPPLVKAANAGLEAWEKRVMAPYKRLLRRDKLRLAGKYVLGDEEFYGRGKRRLRTPRDFRRARVWFQEFSYKNGCALRVCWNVVRMRFRGHRLVGTTNRRGYGAYPPRRAFR